MRVINSKSGATDIDMRGNLPGTLALTTSASSTDVLPAGQYQLKSDVDCFIASEVSPSVTTSTGRSLTGGQDWSNPYWFDGEVKLGGIVASGTGTLTYIRIGG